MHGHALACKLLCRFARSFKIEMNFFWLPSFTTINGLLFLVYLALTDSLLGAGLDEVFPDIAIVFPSSAGSKNSHDKLKMHGFKIISKGNNVHAHIGASPMLEGTFHNSSRSA